VINQLALVVEEIDPSLSRCGAAYQSPRLTAIATFGG